MPAERHYSIPDYESIAAFKERLQGMIAAVCAEEFVARPSYMGCQRCDYVDLCEMGEKGVRITDSRSCDT